MLKIGLTSCFMYPDPKRPVFGPKTLSYMENDMVRFLSRTGVMPILLPDLPDDILYSYLDEMDGFVFAGGSDVAPETYNETGIENNKWPGDSYRDQYEIRILKYALKNKKPIFGICRGCQLINAHLGGTLYQDLITQDKTKLEHRSAEKYDTIHHKIKFEKGSTLFQIHNKKDQIEVNTVHHQGIKELAPSLKAEAYSIPDNIVEAYTSLNLDDQFILAVQWHPEFSKTLEGVVEDSTPLYDYFLKHLEK